MKKNKKIKKIVNNKLNSTKNLLIANKISYTPKISIIVPVYNVAEYLSACLDSILNQTLKEIEVICVNDGSTDSSLEILRNYAEKDSRISVVSRENIGVGASRNEAINLAKGEFLSFMDPDDYYPDNSVLSAMYEAAKKQNVKICGGSLVIYDENKGIEKRYPKGWETFEEDGMIDYKDFQYDYGFQRYIYDTSMIKKNKIYFPNYRRFQDPVFMIKAFWTAGKFYALNKHTYVYRYLHKSVEWTEEKLYHLLCGLRDDLQFAAEHKLTDLYSRTLDRIKKDYKKDLLSQNSDRLQEVKKEIMDLCIKNSKARYKNASLGAKVSVVMPIYNAVPYLRECLDSVLNQTLKNIEIICVNDGSTDNSLDIIKEYADKDSRIKYIDKPNAGYGQTMNCGIDMACGEYIGIVEPDDYIALDMYESLYMKAKGNKLDIVKSNLAIFKGNEKREFQESKYLSDSAFYDKIDTPYNLQQYMTSFNTCAAIYNRNLLLGNKIRYNETPGAAYQDTSFWFKTHCCAKKMCVLDKDFYKYRRDNPNQSVRNTKLGDFLFYEYETVKEFLLKNKKLQFIPLYFYRKFKGCFWYLHVLTPDLKENFLNQMREELLKDVKAGIANTEMFSKSDISVYKNLLSENYLKYFDYLFNKKVSVIIPVYNTEKYLAQCLDSVLNQTLQDIEVICVNDGSTDGSLEILNQYAAKDKRIKIIDQKNAGQGAARNSALKIARGEYICFLDSDDWLDKNTCKELYEYAKKLNLDMINFEGINYDVVKDNFYEVPGLKINYVSNYNKVYSKEEVLSFIDKVTVSACLMFYNADFIRNNDIKFPEGLFFEDNYFMLKALNLVNRYGVMAKCFYFRRKHSEQTTANWNKLFKDYIEIVTKIDELYNELHLENTDMYKVMMNKYCLSAISIYQSFDPADRNQYTRDLYQCIKAISNKVSLDKQILTFLDKVKNNTFYKEQLSNWYRRVRGVFLNLDNPKTYNEKMQWLKLYDSTPIKTQLADKLLVRDWIKDRIGEEYLIPLYGVYDRFEDIDFSKLPEKFVIKCNHGCGYNIIVTDKSALDLDEVKNKLDKWLAENFAFQAGFELHYRDIKPKIIIEKYIDPNISNHEIQVWTFNGKIEFISVETIKDIEDGERGVFYEDGSRAKFEITPQHYKRLDGGFSKKAFNKAIELSKKLLTDIPYVRIDFIEYEDTVIFREMTFTSGSGLSTIKPDRYNMVLGNMLKLPSLVYNIDTGEYYKLPRKSKTASYLLFPYYLVALGRKKKQYKRLMSRIISKHLKTMRIDVKNYGDVDNNVDVNASGTRVIQPLWYANEKGHGSVIESSNEEQQIKITAIGNGILRFAFRAPDKRYKDKRFPLYIDYTSIKIDGRELLSKPVITWHDLPFRYEMPVKNGQVINIIINQRHHKYLKEDLKDIICKVMPLSTYVQKNANKLLKLLRSFITKKSKVHIEDKFTKIIKICGIKFRVHDKHAEILDALNNMRLDINGVIKAQNIKLDRTEHAINNSVKQIEERLDKQTRIVSAEVMGAQDKLNNSLMTIAQELYNGITAVLKDNVMDLNDNLIHMLKIHMYTINRQMDEIKEYYGELQQFTSDTLSIQHKQLKEEAKKLEESINLVSSLIADIKENINKNKQQLLSNIKSDIKSVTNLTQSLLKNNEESALNIMDVVNNMRDDIRSQNVNIKSVADQTEEIVQDLKNSIDAEFKAMPVEIEKKQQYIARLHYEPYWANVYHDTILNSTWLKDKAVSPGRWAVSYIVLYVLYRTLNEMKPMNILECGLGQSSKLTVQYANAHNANLTIFENNPDWIKFFENNFLGADKYIKLLDLEMVELVPPYKSRTYAGFKDSIKDKKFDMVLIDGPLGCERYSRPEILDIVDNLAPSFIIMLDDMNRIGEQDIWKLLKEKLTKKGIAFVERLYASDKVLGVICSPDLQFLTSL